MKHPPSPWIAIHGSDTSKRRITASPRLVLMVCLTPLVMHSACSQWQRRGTESSHPQSIGFHFTDIADQVGLGAIEAKRVMWADLDGDGFADGILNNRRVFMNRPAKRSVLPRVFVERTDASRINVHPFDVDGRRFADCLQIGDVDGDGDLDLFSGKYCDLRRPVVRDDEAVVDEQGRPVMAVTDDAMRSRILLNDGRGSFTVAPDALRPNHAETTSSAAFFDYDNDGRLDLFIGNWYRQYGLSHRSYPSRLYRGLGDGAFVETTTEAGMPTVDEPGLRHSSRPVYGVAHCDFNNDGWQDLLICAYGRQRNMLYKNLGDGTFVDVAEQVNFDGDDLRSGLYPDWVDREKEASFRANGNTFDAACADYDNDGDIDVFLAEITHAWAGESSDPSTLLVNLGAAGGYRFERRLDLGIDRTHSIERWNQGDLYAAWIDFDNDGLLDLLISSGDYSDGQFLRLFKQQPDHRFTDVTLAAGFNWEGSGCLSLADFDHDGDVDILVTRSNVRLPPERRNALAPRVALFRNNIGHKANWLAVTLVGRGAGGANRNAIGARVIVTAGDLVQTREVYGGLGHNSHRNELTLTFGLGRRDRVDSIEVRWPNKKQTSTILKNVPCNKRLTIRE